MKYVDEYRDPARMKRLLAQLHTEATTDSYRLMEFCGGHTHALYRYGLVSALPDCITMVHGPGCPVCVLPAARIDAAVELAKKDGVIFCSYGDMLRVPGSGQSLLGVRAAGADVRVVYSPLDAVKTALDNLNFQVVFFAVGFETTMPATALAVKEAQRLKLKNFFVFCNHVLTPPAIRGIFASDESSDEPVNVHGIVGPGHVSAVIGSDAYGLVVNEFNTPLVISGFEPVDLLESILMLVRQINEGRVEVENQYRRVVAQAGNAKAIALLDDVFVLRGEFEWRGLGMMPRSASALANRYAQFDAEKFFEVIVGQGKEHPACVCPDVLRGKIQPEQCKVFGKACTPETPLGACMVSSEGACAAAFQYG